MQCAAERSDGHLAGTLRLSAHVCDVTQRQRGTHSTETEWLRCAVRSVLVMQATEWSIGGTFDLSLQYGVAMSINSRINY